MSARNHHLMASLLIQKDGRRKDHNCDCRPHKDPYFLSTPAPRTFCSPDDISVDSGEHKPTDHVIIRYILDPCPMFALRPGDRDDWTSEGVQRTPRRAPLSLSSHWVTAREKACRNQVQVHFRMLAQICTINKYSTKTC